MSFILYVLLLMNGQTVDVGHFKPYLVNGVVRVPLRLFAEKAGATVKYESYRHQAILQFKGKTIVFPDNSEVAIVDGQRVNIGATPIKNDNSRYVPVRFLAEEMNMTVSFDAVKKSVKVQQDLTGK